MKRFFTLLILALGFSTAATAQNSITLRFTGENADNAYVRLDSVTVENISRGWTETICYPDTIMELSYNVGIEDVTPAATAFGVTNVRPNPFDGTTQFDLVMPEAGDVHLRITDVNGRLVTASDENLPGGIHTYEVILRRPATYVLHASGRLGTSTAKLVNTGGGSHDGILRAGFAGGVEIRLPLKNIAAHPFQPGDVMRYTGFASYNGTVYTSQPILQPQNVDEDFVMQFDIALSLPNDLTFTVDGVSFTMKPVSGGTFRMGAQKTDPDGQNYDVDADSYESPVHQVTLSSYYMGETEVTQALWQTVTGQSYQWDYGVGNDYPVYYISWNDIQGFLTALNAATASQRGDKTFAMPTEAQWEFAARGGNQGHGYKYAGGNIVGDVAWCADNAYYVGSSHPDYGTHVVKTKSPNELGLYDMSGNVQEWCSDRYGNYSSGSQTDPAGPSSGSNRVLRGGSWGSDAKYCRVSGRSISNPDSRDISYGFRLVLLHHCSAAVVTTDTVSNITEGRAVCGGNVTDEGGAPVTARGVCWSTSQNPTIAGSHTTDGIGTGSFTSSITGLQPATTYYVQAYATNAAGTCYGALRSFTTLSLPNDLTFTVGNVTFTMKPVPSGTFWMGAQSTNSGGQNYDAEAESDESPVHQVTLSDYYMGETEVTQALWQAVTGQSPTSDGSQWSSSYGIGDNYPAYYISWNDIQSFLTALNAATASQRNGRTFAMPTEAQWEFAAKGGNQSHGYKYAGSDSIGNVAWYWDNAYNVGSSHPDYGTHVVKTKSPNELGLYDMSGNVWEWCKDWYGSYGSWPQTDPQGPSSGSSRVLRGGSWYYFARGCRVSDRDGDGPGRRSSNYGFRLVLLP